MSVGGPTAVCELHHNERVFRRRSLSRHRPQRDAAIAAFARSRWCATL